MENSGGSLVRIWRVEFSSTELQLYDLFSPELFCITIKGNLYNVVSVKSYEHSKWDLHDTQYNFIIVDWASVDIKILNFMYNSQWLSEFCLGGALSPLQENSIASPQVEKRALIKALAYNNW